MHIPFEQLPDRSRLWIYQCSRALSDAEVQEAQGQLEQFTQGWQAHGQDLSASFQLLHNRFLILGVDQDLHAPTGCSIDASVAVVRALEQAFGVSFFERTQIPFLIDGDIQVFPMNAIKEKVASGLLTPETTTFNNLIDTKSTWQKEWEVPAKETWLARYF